jgi:predicted acylesterase/phospholipase RssA
MKGGVTSGIVYPAAVCQLAEEYSFCSIGGTSAGAIAAAATAAAEYGRRRQKGTSFAELAELPRLLGEASGSRGPSRLFQLFEPQPETRHLFNTLIAGLSKSTGRFPQRRRSSPGRVIKILAALARNYLLRTWRGVLLVAAIVSVTILLPLVLGGIGSVVAISLPWLILALIGLLVVAGYRLYRESSKVLRQNLHGLVTGMGSSTALTPWLYELLQRLAGRPPHAPLTFGDLWGTATPEREREIDLQMMTTCLSQGRPFRMPSRELDGLELCFQRVQFEKLFPREVIEWLVGHGGGGAPEGYLRLPLGRDLPIIVAVRMSLSFPLLMSAVPLHRVEGGRQEAWWFSDGGICSNFPVHFFDAPLPNWPTFAINLQYLEKPPDDRVIMAKKNQETAREMVHQLDEAGVLDLLKVIGYTMQNWQDNLQSQLPGFLDRVAHICLGPDEGGLNLEMGGETIQKIADLGRDAAELLASRFAPGSKAELNWDNHRWIRLRSLLAMLEKFLDRLGPRLDPNYRPPIRGDANFVAVVEQVVTDPDKYPWIEGQLEEARRTVKELHRLYKELDAGVSLADPAPEPTPELRGRPKI